MVKKLWIREKGAGNTLLIYDCELWLLLGFVPIYYRSRKLHDARWNSVR